jgi:hypothetical protein
VGLETKNDSDRPDYVTLNSGTMDKLEFAKEALDRTAA